AASGSDSGSISTTAELDGDEWVLNGEKIFVTCADRCDAVVVWATLDKEAGKRGIKSFVVEKGTPGFTLAHLEHKLGIRASDTGTFVLNNCRIPKGNILGSAEIKKTTEGFKGVMKTFDNTRPMVAAMSLGIARAALDFTREKLDEAGVALDYETNPNNQSSMQKDYLWMEANLEAMRLLTWRAAWMADNETSNSLEASMCKAKAGRYGTLITLKCAEILGPLGISREYLAEKWMRDSKIMDIFEGTGQIQHLIIARSVLKMSSKELK
ncbi:MAG: acyl-CoA dehydrogenase family protein, partial [Pseudomonadota bacterium]